MEQLTSVLAICRASSARRSRTRSGCSSTSRSARYPTRPPARPSSRPRHAGAWSFGEGARADPGRGGGFPYFIQEYGPAWSRRASGRRFTADAVPEALPVAQEILDEEFFDNRVEEATNEERRYMAAMADLGDGPQSTGEDAGARASGSARRRARRGRH